MSNLDNLIESLSEPEKKAIYIIKLAIDCYNSADGSGMFSGPDRYNKLAARIEISAVQANNLPKFWALLLKRMQWQVPSKQFDGEILNAIQYDDDDNDVLRVLANETASIITLARMLHDEAKAAKKLSVSDFNEEQIIGESNEI